MSLAVLRSPEEKAAREAIAHWAPLVARAARRFARVQRRVHYDELVAAGQLAVVTAERSRLRDGTEDEWGSFMAIRVRWAMKDALRRADPLSSRARKAGVPAPVLFDEPEEVDQVAGPCDQPDRDERRDAWQQLAPLLDALCPRDRSIVEATFLGGRTVRDVGREHGVTGVRITQIRNLSLRRMRARALSEACHG